MTVTRRDAIVAGIVGAAGLGAVVAAQDRGEPTETSASPRMPVVFVPHGGGPWPFVDVGFGNHEELAALAEHLAGLATVSRTPPRAVLMISAHWEAPVPTVMTHPRPPMLYDYYGFPPESYQITWPAPGDPALAQRVRDLLGGAGFATDSDAARGFDHGAFVPLKLAFPEATVPTVQLSLIAGLDPARHLELGRALAPLRDEGVLIVGSGMSYHDLRGFGRSESLAVAEAFDAWLRETTVLEQGARDRALTAWAQAPAARRAHPREEHLAPLFVAAGAAGADRATIPYNGTLMGLRLSSYRFG